MKSLFSRLRNRETPPSSRSPSSTSQENGKDPFAAHPISSTNTGPSLGPPRPITPIATLHSQSSTPSSGSSRPRSSPGISDTTDEVSTSQIVGDDGTVRGRTISAGEAGVKKVTFRSPAPTPTTSLVLDELTPNANHQEDKRGRTISSSSNRLPLPPTSPTKRPAPNPLLISRPDSSRSSSASRQSLSLTSKPIVTRKSSLPHSSSMHSNGSETKSAMSPTPSDHSLSGTSTRSYLPPPNSWSEMAEEELIANLGPRERTRQEVLWEIVSSEERYVQELIKLNETFCRALLPATATSPSLSLFDPSSTLARTLSPSMSPTPTLPTESFDYLPIAARYASSRASTTSPPLSTSARMNAYHILTNGRPSEAPSRQPSSTSLNAGAKGAPGRSHWSLPPPRRDSSANGATKSFSALKNRVSYQPGAAAGSRLSKIPDGRAVSASSAPTPFSRGKEIALPADLAKILSVLAGGILQGHVKLATALRKRYENQYPLVRSLADVFTSHSYILREYATYVLHLEQALSQADNALSTYTSALANKRSSRRIEETDTGRLGKLLLTLEETAAERGESGLVISLSKPFQRLLKYPLLFQNLLFNTDPSLKEYEATLAMVDEVEEIVRTIEDEKASSEERERTRDVWARIEGLDKDKMLMAPKPNRLLVEETQSPQGDDTSKTPKDASVKTKKSIRRLSDILKGSGDTTDLWVVRFSDVSLLCERTGLTNLPLSTLKKTFPKNESGTDLGGKSKFATTGRRAASVKARNLYKFIRIHQWHLKARSESTEPLVSMEDISRQRVSSQAPSVASQARQSFGASKTKIHLNTPPGTPGNPIKVPLKGDGGPSPSRTPRATRGRDADAETVVSDGVSVMSFAFKGSDQIKPVARKARPSILPPGHLALSTISTETRDAPGAWPYRRDAGGNVAGSAANAKFANRLRSPELDHHTMGMNGEITVRPASRTRRSLPPAMIGRSSLGQATSVNSALSPSDQNGNASRLPWNSSTKPLASPKQKPDAAPSVASVRGLRGAGAAPSSISGKRLVPKASTSSAIAPSGSEDSGVAGLWVAYRDGGAVGTPVKPVTTGRSMGRRI